MSEKLRAHKCVFTPEEIEILRKLPFDMSAMSKELKLIIGILIAVLAIVFVPTTFIISQSSAIGVLTAAANESVRSQERFERRLDRFDEAREKAFKKLFWAEKHSKDAKRAVEELTRELKKNRWQTTKK